jgi:protocatechuate 3,4-dioxygenase beta subunit
MPTPPDKKRRHALRALGAAFVSAPLGAALGCSSGPSTPTSASTSDTTTSSGGGATAQCVESATETRGPYPDLLGMSGNQAFYRQDIREGRPGTSLTVTFTVVNTRNACAPVANAAVEIWQCDADGRYSEYAQGGFDGRGQTFLRGLQVTSANGQCSFVTIYPGWYQGRATHIHVDVLVNGQRVKSTQMAFPEDVTAQVYAQGAYAAKGQNSTTNARDNVFSDGTSTEMANVSGSPAAGYTAALQVGIAI